MSKLGFQKNISEEILEEDISSLISFCRKHLDITNIDLGGEYHYAHLPLCVIDAVFSIGVQYTSVTNTVSRFCDFFDITTQSSKKILPLKEQISIVDFLKMYEEHGIDVMTEQAYKNRQRTSTKNGILKSEAIFMFAQTLDRHGIHYLQDIQKALKSKEFESDIRKIPGQRSGISLRYFFMLTGSEDLIKPDRMINRFLHRATGKSFSLDNATKLLIKCCDVLKNDFPNLTPRALDKAIWEYQRTQ